MSANDKPIFLVVTSRDCGACSNFIANGQLDMIEEHIRRNLGSRVRYGRIVKDIMNAVQDRILTMKITDYQTGTEEIYYANIELNMFVRWFPNFILLPARLQPLHVAEWNDDDTLIMNDNIEWPSLDFDKIDIFGSNGQGELLPTGELPPMNSDSIMEWLKSKLEKTTRKRRPSFSAERTQKKTKLSLMRSNRNYNDSDSDDEVW